MGASAGVGFALAGRGDEQAGTGGPGAAGSIPGRPTQLLVKGLPTGMWQAWWFDPHTGGETAIGEARADAEHQWRAPSAPSQDD